MKLYKVKRKRTHTIEKMRPACPVYECRCFYDHFDIRAADTAIQDEFSRYEDPFPLV